MKHLFALAAPLVFVFLASCDFTGKITGTVDVQCPLPLPVITDTTLTGTFNAACPYLYFNGDTLRIVTPGVNNV